VTNGNFVTRSKVGLPASPDDSTDKLTVRCYDERK
jgi:hypothetical protein